MKKNFPNILTIFRGVLTIGIIILFFSGLDNRFFLIYVFFLLAALSDFWDGFLARKWKAVSDFGIVADPLLDKALVFSMLILLFPFNIISGALIWILLLRDVVTDIMKYILMKKKTKTPAIKLAKYKTAFQLLLINFMLLYLIFDQIEFFQFLAISCSVLAVTFSLLSGFLYTKRFIILLKIKKI